MKMSPVSKSLVPDRFWQLLRQGSEWQRRMWSASHRHWPMWDSDSPHTCCQNSQQRWTPGCSTLLQATSASKPSTRRSLDTGRSQACISGPLGRCQLHTPRPSQLPREYFFWFCKRVFPIFNWNIIIYLRASNNESTVSCSMIIKQLENVDASICDHDKTREEHDTTNSQGAPSSVLASAKIINSFFYFYFSFCYYLSWGKWSVKMVITVSVVENWVPKPRESNIMKKRTLQRGDIGILETASG